MISKGATRLQRELGLDTIMQRSQKLGIPNGVGCTSDEKGGHEQSANAAYNRWGNIQDSCSRS
jgi:hypothetical protein